MPEITLAHSPDPDDVFMWWPISGMIEPPRDAQVVEAARVLSKPVIDTGRFGFVPIAADIAMLNRRAIERGDLEITALSVFAWAHVRARYRLTSFGSSMGYGYGPRIVGRRGKAISSSKFEVRKQDSEVEAKTARDSGSQLKALVTDGALIAVPGVKTTAFLLLSMMLGDDRATLKFVEMPFDRILDAVASGEGGVTHGLLIHQSQLTFGELGLELIADVGEWWLAETGLPLPLGGNAVRSDLDERFGAGATREVVNVLDRSIRYAVEHREQSLAYCMRFAPELSRGQAERYIEMYVNDLTVDAGEAGERAVGLLIERGAAMGMCPPASEDCVKMLRPRNPL